MKPRLGGIAVFGIQFMWLPLASHPPPLHSILKPIKLSSHRHRRGECCTPYASTFYLPIHCNIPYFKIKYRLKWIHSFCALKIWRMWRVSVCVCIPHSHCTPRHCTLYARVRMEARGIVYRIGYSNGKLIIRRYLFIIMIINDITLEKHLQIL